MAMIRKLVKHGNSVALCIDKSILDILGWEAGTPIRILAGKKSKGKMVGLMLMKEDGELPTIGMEIETNAEEEKRVHNEAGCGRDAAEPGE